MKRRKMVEGILVGSMVVATGSSYLAGFRTGGDENKKYDPFPFIAAIVTNYLCLLSLGFGISVKNVEILAENVGKIFNHEPAALVPLIFGLGIAAIGTMAVATFAPPLLYEKGIEDGKKMLEKKKEGENE